MEHGKKKRRTQKISSVENIKDIDKVLRKNKHKMSRKRTVRNIKRKYQLSREEKHNLCSITEGNDKKI